MGYFTRSHHQDKSFISSGTGRFSTLLQLFHFHFFAENDRPTSLVPDLIDYNMPLTATYLKQMKLQCMSNNERVRTTYSFKNLNSCLLNTWTHICLYSNYRPTIINNRPCGKLSNEFVGGVPHWSRDWDYSTCCSAWRQNVSPPLHTIDRLYEHLMNKTGRNNLSKINKASRYLCQLFWKFIDQNNDG